VFALTNHRQLEGRQDPSSKLPSLPARTWKLITFPTSCFIIHTFSYLFQFPMFHVVAHLIHNYHFQSLQFMNLQLYKLLQITKLFLNTIATMSFKRPNTCQIFACSKVDVFSLILLLFVYYF
jgi:hypothetical protein